MRRTTTEPDPPADATPARRTGTALAGGRSVRDTGRRPASGGAEPADVRTRTARTKPNGTEANGTEPDGTRAGRTATGRTGTASSEAAYGDADVAPVASLFADASRARVLTALADGRALPASMLAAEAGLSPQGVSSHLAKLLAAGLVEVERSGRNRYYRLSGPAVADVLEALSRLAPARPVRSLREGTRAQAMRAARTCYDHLAGRLGTAITAALLDRGALAAADGDASTRRRPGEPLSAQLTAHPYALGPHADAVFAGLGVDLPAVIADRARRPLLRFCVDWTEQRHHLSGRLGAALATALLDAGWLARAPRPRRAVRLTDTGRSGLSTRLGLDLD